MQLGWGPASIFLGVPRAKRMLASMGDGCGWEQRAGQRGQEGKELSCRAWQVTVMCLTDHKHAGLVTWMGWGWFRGG